MPTAAQPVYRYRMANKPDTTPESTLRRRLHAHGLRFARRAHDLPGRPDLVLPRRRSVIFVRGCFWHGPAARSIAQRPDSRPAPGRRRSPPTARRTSRTGRSCAPEAGRSRQVGVPARPARGDRGAGVAPAAPLIHAQPRTNPIPRRCRTRASGGARLPAATGTRRARRPRRGSEPAASPAKSPAASWSSAASRARCSALRRCASPQRLGDEHAFALLWLQPMEAQLEAEAAQRRLVQVLEQVGGADEDAGEAPMPCSIWLTSVTS